MTDAYVPLTGTPDLHDAICATHRHPDLWQSTDDADKSEAIRLCNTCQHITQCLTKALDNHETAGIWGGQDMAHDNGPPRPECALVGCFEQVAPGRKRYCSAAHQHEAERRYSVPAVRRRRQEQRQAGLQP
jgi:Transcription factor WhiB